MIQVGTRTRQLLAYGFPSSRAMTKSDTRDVGMTKNVTASFTFGSGQVTAASGLGVFAFNDELLVEGANLNNGYFRVTSVSGTALGLEPPPKAEGPITCSIRTS